MLSPLDLKNKMMEPKKRKYYDKDETDDYLEPVSYTHLDVYKRQEQYTLILCQDRR